MKAVSQKELKQELSSRSTKELLELCLRLSRFKKENKEKRVIFVSHNVPYNTKLDLVNSKDAHKKAKGKHLGSKLVRRTIEKYKPFLYFGGHVHESSGLDKLGKTILVNPGAVYDNQMVLVNLSENNKSKFNIKFIK